MLIQYLWIQYTQVETMPYSQFEQLLNANKIAEVLVGSETIQGTLKESFPDGRSSLARPVLTLNLPAS
jgi:cell division protease FtsH